jgi:hypothetical protein
LTQNRKEDLSIINADYKSFVDKFDFYLENYHKIIIQILGITLSSIKDQSAVIFNKFYRLLMEIKRLAKKINLKMELGDLNLTVTESLLIAVRIINCLTELYSNSKARVCECDRRSAYLAYHHVLCHRSVLHGVKYHIPLVLLQMPEH